MNGPRVCSAGAQAAFFASGVCVKGCAGAKSVGEGDRVCRETERDHGGEMNRGGGALLGAALGLIGWTLILMFVL